MNRAVRIFWNKWRQWRKPQVKIFFVGFHKCGTTSIHHLLKSQGVRSAHYTQDGRNLAVEIESRMGSPSLKEFLDRSTAYSDICYFTNETNIEGIRHFREFERLYPDAYFVLNDRDLDAWIDSRCRQTSKKRGSLLARAMAFYGVGGDEVRDIWRQQYQEHVAAVLDHFSKSDCFLHFRIDRDPITRLTEFLAPSFLLDAKQWKIKNKTARMALDGSSEDAV